MYSKEMSFLMPNCDCFNKKAKNSKMQIYGMPYEDVEVGYGARFDRGHNKFEAEKIWLDLNYCPQCGAKLTKIER